MRSCGGVQPFKLKLLSLLFSQPDRLQRGFCYYYNYYEYSTNRKHIEDLLTALAGKRIFSKIDRSLSTKFQLRRLTSPKRLPSPRSVRSFLVVTVEFQSHPAIFERNDILVSAESPEQHLHMLFERLNNYGLVINVMKCTPGVLEIKFLGCTINKDGAK